MISNGVDIVLIDRFKNINENFLKKYFTKKELDYIKSKNNNIETIAGIYAAKEAFLKSLGISLDKYSLKDIEIDHDKGMPIIVLHNDLIKEKQKHFCVSISHDGDYAIAFVISY